MLVRFVKTISHTLYFLRKITKQKRAVYLIYFASFFLSILYILSTIVTPLVFKALVTHLVNGINEPLLNILIIAGGYCLVWFIAQVSEQLREIAICSAIHKAVTQAFIEVYERKLDEEDLEINDSSGNQLALFSMFQETFPNFVTGFFYYIIPLILQLFTVSIVLGIQCGWIYTAIFINISFVLFLITYYRVNHFLPLQTDALKGSLSVLDYLSDRYMNFETVILFGDQKKELNNLSLLLSDFESKQTKSSIYMESTRLLQGIIFSVVLCIMTFLSIYGIFFHKQQLSDFFMLNAYVLQIVSPLSALSFILTDLSRGVVTLERFFSKNFNALHDKSNCKNNELIQSIKKIEFRNVGYEYNASKTILKNISFVIDTGKTVALIGESGSGKSTLASLLCFFFPPKQGIILLNDVPFNQYDKGSIRSQFSIVPQSIQLFNDSLYNNIIYSNPNVNFREFEEALYISCLSEWVESLEQGVNTNLGELGKKISGGQRQRIALARALLKKSSVLILDEFSSHLDSLTTEKIYERLKKLRPKTTIFSISHQLENIVTADYILLLADGCLCAQGTHQDLLLNNTLYQKMFNARIASNKIGDTHDNQEL